MSQAGIHAAAFYSEVAVTRRVWTIRDENGFPAPRTPSGARAQPFWSSKKRAEKIVNVVRAFAGFEVVEMTWEEFKAELESLKRDGLMVGTNWTGANATGYDLDPDWVERCVAIEIANAAAPRE